MTGVAAAAGGSSVAAKLVPQTTTLRRALVLAGGLFVLVAVTGWVVFGGARRSAASGVPNTAAAAILFTNGTGLVVQEDPSAFVAIQTVASSADLTVFRTRVDLPESVEVRPVARGVLALGTTQDTERVRVAEKIPWWIRARVAWRLRAHDGTVLWAPNQDSPWQIGVIDHDQDFFRISLPLPAPQTNMPPIETSLKDALRIYMASQAPVSSRSLLPDRTVITELRIEPDTFIWSEAPHELGTVVSLVSPAGEQIFRYVRLKEFHGACPKGQQDKFSAYFSQDIIILCIADFGDKM